MSTNENQNQSPLDHSMSGGAQTELTSPAIAISESPESINSSSAIIQHEQNHNQLELDSDDSNSPLDSSAVPSPASSSSSEEKKLKSVRFPPDGDDLVQKRDASNAEPLPNPPVASSSSGTLNKKSKPSKLSHFPSSLSSHLIPKQIKRMVSSPLASPPLVQSDSEEDPANRHDLLTNPPRDTHEDEAEDYFSPRQPSGNSGKYFPSDDSLSRQTWENTMYNRESGLADESALHYPYPTSPGCHSLSDESINDSRTSLESGNHLLAPPERARLPSLGDAIFHPNGGMAPGLRSFDYEDDSSPPSPSEHLPTSYNDGSYEDIPLRKLDTKLREIKRRTEMSQAAEHAEQLVRTYTKGPQRHYIRRGSRAVGRSTEEHGTGGRSADSKTSLTHRPTLSTDSLGDTGFVVENTGFLDSEDSLNEIGRTDSTGETLIEEPHHEDYVAPPSHVKLGVLGTLLTMYNHDNASMASTPGGSPTATPGTPEPKSGRNSPRLTDRVRPKLQARLASYEKSSPKWYQHKRAKSANSLSGIVLASQTLAAPGMHNDITMGKINRVQKRGGKTKLKDQIRITVHIADVLQRQRFILRMCKALMLFGAPTHRLEEYMKMTSRVLEIDGQFLYIPGCMICSFGDSTTHTSEMRLVRVTQGLNLSHLHEAHLIYKEVVHDVIGVEEASSRLDELLKKKNLYPRWVCTIAFGLSSAFFALLSFGGTWTDFPISFVLGGCVGFLQICVAPRSALYSNIFEVTSSIIVSFLGRAFGSIGSKKNVFCFAAIAQGSLALILPGYTILCGALELQSKNIVSGAVRMFYAIIYSLFLGFGITLGAIVYGWIDRNATSATTCEASLTPWLKFFFLPGATCFIAIVNQARARELPIMTALSAIGYVVTYFLNKELPGAKQFSSAIAAFAVGIFGNIYSRVGHGLAFSAMLPAIFVLVPGGIAAQGSLVAGIKSADEIISNHSATDDAFSSNSAMNLGMNMILVSVGITVGLFVATLFIYPFGKKRSGLFTF